MTLVAANALVENTTFLGPTLADASLDLASVAFLRMSSSESPPKFVDDASRVEIEGVVTVTVTDAFGVPQADARVLVEDNVNGTWSATAIANAEGRVAGLVVPEQRMSKLGSTDFQPLSVMGQVGALQGRTDVRLHGFAEVTVAVPADLTPPTPIATRFLAADEDVPVTFDASASTDNDPGFVATGAFVWRFPEIGVELNGITASHAFATPALVQGVLTATDAAGNEASLSFAIQIRDITLPSIVSVQVPATGGTGQLLTFTATATDNDPLFAQSGSYVWRFTRGTQTVQRFGPSVTLAFEDAGSWAVELTVRDPTGNEAVRSATVAIVAPPTPNPWPAILVGGALLAAALAAATERGKVGLFTLFIPLYTRIKDGDVLDQFTRGQIYGYVRMNPGDTYTDIKRNLGLNNGTLTYHLDVLEKQGYVRSVVRGARKMFFPLDVTPPEDGGGLAEIQRRLVKALHEAPGIAVTDLAASLGVSRQLALYHLRLLAGQGLVRLERRGVKLCGVPVSSNVRDVGRRIQESP
jgi:DNA-binding transcriptional ArsR family regulator